MDECDAGEKALPIIEDSRPDVVVMGLNPTGITDGVELCSQIKSIPEGPYVLIHTAYNYAEDVSSCFLAGADSYLHKSAESRLTSKQDLALVIPSSLGSRTVRATSVEADST